MIENVTDNIVRIYFKGIFSCNAYYIKDRRILIDTSSISARKAFKQSLPVAPEDVSMVLLTHMHHDHVGSIGLFQDCPIYASETAIRSLQEHPRESVYDMEAIQSLYENNFDPQPFPKDKLKDIGFTIFDTPGHAEGSVCILYEGEDGKILFSGDLFFDSMMKVLGRTDLPTSDKEKMTVSLRKMSAIRYDVLCPGHGKPERNL